MVPKARLHTQLYGQQAAQFYSQEQQLGNHLQKNTRDLAMNQQLYAAKVVARVELEGANFAYRKHQDEAYLPAETQRSQWQTDLNAYWAILAELR